MSSWRVLAAAPAMALAAAVMGVPAPAPAVAGPTYVILKVPEQVPVDTRALLRAHVDGGRPCGPYGACRSRVAEGTVTWTLVSFREPDVHLRHVSTLEHGRARWRTPQLHVRGKWSVKAAYATKDGQLLADNATTLRVTRP